MKAETLKKSILQYAMQGKLVAQDPNDEPASEILKRIKAEKEQLIKDGKIKKEKPLPPIIEDELPYELPQNWKWARLGYLCNLYTGNSISENLKISKYSKIQNGFDYIGTKDVTFENAIIYNNGIKIPIEETDFKYAYNNSILLCIEGGSAGRKIAISNKQICFGNKLCAFNIYLVLPKFLYYFMQSPIFLNIFADNKSGIIGGVSIAKLKELYCCVPPLQEQQRIVEKLEEILPLVEEYGKNEEILSEMNKKLPKQIRQSILQYAVQGKLVPQNPNDEPASELLKRIKAEKEQLIKDGKIKKEKPLPPITEDEIPYELPQGWKWVRLRDLTEIITKGSSPSWQGVNYTDNNEVLFITSENVGKFKLLLSKIKYVEHRFNEIEPRSILEYNDILMNIVGASIGRTAIFDLKDTLANINQATCIIRIVKKFKTDALLKYLLLFFNSPICYMYMNKDQVDSARANLSMTNIANFLIPLPPPAEQQRIVTKVEELMSIANKLEHKEV